jgi:VanZ family protein
MKNDKKHLSMVLIVVRALLWLFAGFILWRCIFDPNYNKVGACLAAFLLPLVPDVVKAIFKIKMPFRIEMLYYIFIAIAHCLGICLDLYVFVPYYDKIVHCLSGVATALIGHYAVDYFNVQRSPRLFRGLFIMFFSMAIATAWEFFEFAMDKFLGFSMQQLVSQGLDDTMYDLISATIGSFIGGWLMSRKGVSQYLIEK